MIEKMAEVKIWANLVNQLADNFETKLWIRKDILRGEEVNFQEEVFSVTI